MNIAQTKVGKRWRISLYDNFGQLIGRTYRRKPVVINSTKCFNDAADMLLRGGICV